MGPRTKQVLYANKQKGLCRFSPGERVPQDLPPRAIRVIVDRGLTTRNSHVDTIGSDLEAAVWVLAVCFNGWIAYSWDCHFVRNLHQIKTAGRPPGQGG